MDVSSPLSLAANSISLCVLSAKTIYDLIINPWHFRIQKNKIELMKAAKKKRERTDLSTALTFMFLAISYALFIWEATYGK